MSDHHYNKWTFSNYPLVRIIVPYIIGLLLADLIEIPYNYIMLIIGLCLLLLISKKLSTTSFHVLLFVTAFLFGNVWMQKSNTKHVTSNYTHQLKNNEKHILAVRLLSQGEEKERSVLYEAQVIGIKTDSISQWNAAEGKIPIYLLGKKEGINKLSYGDTLIFETYLNEFQAPFSKYHFDYQKYMHNRGYFHQVFLREDQLIYHASNKAKLPLLLRARHVVQDILNKSIPNPTTHSLMSAVLLNEKTQMNPELRTHFSKTGISHIIAISGMHVSILCGFLLFLIPYIKNNKGRIAVFLLAFILVWTYIAITKFPPSAIRAASMFTLGIIGIFLHRKVYSINNLIITALIMLVYQPLWIWDVGFQLSFLAVLSILCFNPSIQNLYNSKHQVVNYIWAIISISLSVQILVFPLILYYFNSFPLLVLLANIPAVIYSFLLLSGSFILIGVYFIHPQLSIILGQILSYITDLFYSIIQWLSYLTPDLFQSFQISNIDLALIYLLVFAIMLSVYKKGLKYWIGSSVILSLLVVVYLQDQHYKSKENFLFIFQQRQSYYIFIKMNQQGYLLHPPGANEDIYQYNIAPLEKGYQLKHVDQFEWTLWEDISLPMMHITNGISQMKSKAPLQIRLLGYDDLKEHNISEIEINDEQIIFLPDVPFYLIDEIKKEFQTVTDSLHFLREKPFINFVDYSSSGNIKKRSRVSK